MTPVTCMHGADLHQGEPHSLHALAGKSLMHALQQALQQLDQLACASVAQLTRAWHAWVVLSEAATALSASGSSP